MNFDHNKYFTSALMAIITPTLKEVGFKKRGSITFVRRTEFNIIQVVNFQKSKYGNKAFYVNIGNLTLHKKIDKFFTEIGNRIGSFDNSINTTFNFQIPIIGDISLKDIRSTLRKIIIPYFDFCKSLNSIHELSLFATKNIIEFPYLKTFAYRDLTQLPVDESLAFRLLCLRKYPEALAIYKGIQERKFNTETKDWIYKPTDRYKHIIEQLSNKDYQAIENEIDENIDYSLSVTKFDKLKITKTSDVKLDNLLKLLKPKETLPSPRSQFPFYHYKIYGHEENKVSFSKIRKTLESKYEIIEREHELLIQIDNDFSFYLAINDADYVLTENSQIIKLYRGKKDVEWISSLSKRIEFWSSNDENMDYFNEHLFLIESLAGLKLEWLHGEKLLFFDEN